MQFQSNAILTIMEPKRLPSEFPVVFQDYVQEYCPESKFHYHDCMELGMCVHGSGIEMINNQSYLFQKESVTIIPQNCIHDSHIIGQSKDAPGSVWKFIFFRPEDFGITSPLFGGFLTDDLHISRLFWLLYEELEAKRPHYKQLCTQLFSALLLYATREAPDAPLLLPAQMPPEMVKTINTINFGYHRMLTVEQLAYDCNLSVSSFCRMFKKCFGIAPLAYVNRLRLTVAQYLLQTTNMSILSISSEVGFRTLSSFNRSFKKLYGISPRSMRQNRSQQPVFPQTIPIHTKIY